MIGCIGRFKGRALSTAGLHLRAPRRRSETEMGILGIVSSGFRLTQSPWHRGRSSRQYACGFQKTNSH